MNQAPSMISFTSTVITEKRPNCKRDIDREVRQWSWLSTAHGIMPVLNTGSRIFRIIWLACLLGSLGMCSYMVYRCVSLYLKWEVVIKVDQKNVNELTFPSVTICNLNPFVTPDAFTYIRDYYNNEYNKSLQNYSDFVDLVNAKQIVYETDWLFYQTFDPDFNKTLKRSFGYKPAQLVTNCYMNEVACDPLDFTWSYSPLYGNCYTINSGWNSLGKNKPLYTVNREGRGLEMQVFVGLDDAIYPYMYEPAAKGMVIIIDDQRSLAIKKQGILNPNDYVKIPISKTVTHSLPLPYGDCQYGDTVNTVLSREMKLLGMPYSKQNCMTLCEQMQTIEFIGCYDMRLPRILNASACRKQFEFELMKILEFNYTRCGQLCPFECDAVTYDASTSYSQFPTYNFYVNETISNPTYYEGLYGTANVTYEYFVNGIGKVSIFYDALRFTEVSSKPSFEIMDLIANVGGTLGLFLGVSLLSLVEFFELTFIIVAVMCRNGRANYTLAREIRKERKEREQNRLN